MAASDAMERSATGDTSALRAAQRDYEVLAAASADLAQSAARTCPLIGPGLARLRWRSAAAENFYTIKFSIISLRNSGNILPGVMELSWRRTSGLEYSKVNT